MLAKLLLLFILVPALELVLLIQMGRFIGTIPTIVLVFSSGMIGAYLIKRQGVQVLSRIRGQFQMGQLPADSIFDGALILVAGALLLTPGVITDMLGLLCLIPATRRVIKKVIWSRIERMMRSGQRFGGTYQELRHRKRPEDVIIIEHDELK